MTQIYRLKWSFQGGSAVKNSAYNVGDMCSIPRWGRIPWRRKWQSTPEFLPGKPHVTEEPGGLLGSRGLDVTK